MVRLPRGPVADLLRGLEAGLVACYVVGPDGVVRNVLKPDTGDSMAHSAGSQPYTCTLGIGAGGAGDTKVQVATFNSILPVSIFGLGVKISAGSLYSGIFGVRHNNTGSSPYLQYAIEISGSTTNDLNFNYNAAGSPVALAGGAGSWSQIANGQVFCLGGTLITGSQRLYVNGKLQASATAAIASISAGATAEVYMGGGDTVMSLFCIWKQVLTNSDMSLLWSRSKQWTRSGRAPRPIWDVPGAVGGGGATYPGYYGGGWW